MGSLPIKPPIPDLGVAAGHRALPPPLGGDHGPAGHDRTPVVYTEHNIVSSYRQPTRLVNRLTYGRNAAVIAVSDAVAESLVGFPGPSRE